MFHRQYRRRRHLSFLLLLLVNGSSSTTTTISKSPSSRSFVAPATRWTLVQQPASTRLLLGLIRYNPLSFAQRKRSSGSSSSSSRTWNLTFVNRCRVNQRTMACRPPILSTTTTSSSPITTTYRKHLLAVFAQSAQSTIDDDITAATNTTTSNEDEPPPPPQQQQIAINHTTTATGTGSASNHVNYNDEYLFLKQVSTLSSSPQRLCAVSAMTQCCTVQDIYDIRNDYNTAAQQLHAIMSNPNISGDIKHQTHCQHRYNYGRQPFVCKDCWSYLPICICHKQQYSGQPQPLQPTQDTPIDDHTDPDSIFRRVPRLPLPPLSKLSKQTRQLPNSATTQNNSTITHFDGIDVIMWTHHKEWGSPSNTGSVLVVALQQLYHQQPPPIANDATVRGHMLMKGYTEHDQRLEQLFQPQQEHEIVIPVVLWAPTATADDDDDAEEGHNGNNNSEVTTSAATTCGTENSTSNIQPPIAPKRRQFVSVQQLLYELQEIKSTAIVERNVNIKRLATSTAPSIRLVIIAVEGTWNQAKRMVTKLPPNVRALHLSDLELFHWRTSSNQNNNGTQKDDVVVDDSNGEVDVGIVQHQKAIHVEPVQIRGAVSILDPLRKQKTLNRYPNTKKYSSSTVKNSDTDVNKDGSMTTTTIDIPSSQEVINTNKVCTAEAAVSALMAIHAISIPEGDYIINLADQKVLRTVAYQGKMTLRNLIAHW